MFCVNCQKQVEPEIVTGADIYGQHFAFASALFARCPVCGNYGECAAKGEPPYEVIPDFRMRKGYNCIDGVLKLMWMQKRMTKAEVLYRMADMMYGRKRDYRTHDIRSYDEACRAYRLAKELKKEVFNAENIKNVA